MMCPILHEVICVFISFAWGRAVCVLPNLHAGHVFCCCMKMKAIPISQPPGLEHSALPGRVAQTHAHTDTCSHTVGIAGKATGPLTITPLTLSRCQGLKTQPQTRQTQAPPLR